MKTSWEIRDLRRLNALIDGLWLLDTQRQGDSLRERLGPYSRENEAVHELRTEFAVLAGCLASGLPLVLGTSKMSVVDAHLLTTEAMSWYSSLILDIGPVDVPYEVQMAVIAGATYELARTKVFQDGVDLETVEAHVWSLCFSFERPSDEDRG